MNSDDVLRILDVLEEADVRVWLDGGWGVDALLGEQTRPHNDLDIAMKHVDVPVFMQVMEGAGFRPVDGGTPVNFVLRDGGGREVDVHLVDIDSVRLNDQGIEIYGPNGQEYEVGSLDGRGIVDGRPVACRVSIDRLSCPPATHAPVGNWVGEFDRSFRDPSVLGQID